MPSHLNPDGTVNLDDEPNPNDPNARPRHLDPDAIAACTMCDEHAYRPNGVVCDHQDHTAETPGRAAFHAEMARLRAKRVDKARGA